MQLAFASFSLSFIISLSFFSLLFYFYLFIFIILFFLVFSFGQGDKHACVSLFINGGITFAFQFFDFASLKA